MDQKNVLSAAKYLANLRQAVCITNTDLELRYVNKAFEDLFLIEVKNTNEIYLNKLVSLQLQPETWQQPNGQLLEIKNNKGFFVTAFCHPVEGKQGEFIWLFEPITKTSDRGVFNSVSEAILIIDLNGSIIEANDEMAAKFGYQKSDLKGKHLNSFFEKDSVFWDELSELAKGKRHISGNCTAITRNGNKMPVELSISKGNYYDEPAYFAVMRDLSDIQQSKQAIEREKAYFKSLFESVPFGIVLLDKDDVVVDCNQHFTKLFQYSLEDAVGHTINDLIVPADLWEDGTTLTKSVALGQPIFREANRRRKDGSLVEVSIIGRPFAMPDGEQMVFGIYQDISERMAFRRALQKEKTYFEFLFESIPFGLVLLDKADNIVDCNAGFSQLFGYEKNELVGKNNINIIFSTLYEQEGIDLRARVASGERIYTETLRKCKDGALVDVGVTGRQLKMEDGSVFIFAMYQDITDRKRAERELNESRKQLANLIDNLPGMVYRCRYDDDYSMLYVSESSYKVLGYKPEDFFGDKAISFNEKILEQYRDKIRLKWDETLSTKKPFEMEYEIKHADGTIRWVWERGKGVYDSFGNLVFLEGYIEDITDHKAAEQALHNERELMQALMDNIPDTIYFKDLQSRFIRINYAQARALGVKSPEDATGKTDLDFFNDEHAAMALKNEKELFETGDPLINQQERIKTANGWRWFSASKVPLFDEDGNVTGLAGISRDLTEFKNMEQALRDNEQKLLKSSLEKDKLFSVIAHDLRSPFNSFLMLTEIFNDESFGMGPEDIKELSKNMHKSVSSLYDLLDNLLSWSAVQRNKVVVSKSNLQLKELIDNTLGNFDTMISKKQHTVINATHDDEIIYADRAMMAVVLRNIFSNAFKFTQSGGEVYIYSEIDSQGFVSVSVKDSGIGIPGDMLDKLFTLESKGRKGTDGEPTAGLGLTLAKDFLELQGGRISVESVENAGSTFTMVLPPKP